MHDEICETGVAGGTCFVKPKGARRRKHCCANREDETRIPCARPARPLLATSATRHLHVWALSYALIIDPWSATLLCHGDARFAMAEVLSLMTTGTAKILLKNSSERTHTLR